MIEQKQYYCASILLLLQPWRNVEQLKAGYNDWVDAYEDFYTHSDKNIQDIISGIQYFYDCKSVAENKDESFVDHNTTGKENVETKETIDSDDDDDDNEQLSKSGGVITSTEIHAEQQEIEENFIISQEDLEIAMQHQVPTREKMHGQTAVEIARAANLFQQGIPLHDA